MCWKWSVRDLQNGSQGGSGHGGDERDPGRNWSPTGYDGKRYTEEKKKMKDKRRLEEGILAWVSFQLLMS